jgi:hypothetical protein
MERVIVFHRSRLLDRGDYPLLLRARFLKPPLSEAL